ncbi:hemolysin D [Sulfuriferula sp. AH1]|uniref:efflux RND transporter periplasmic adaptor subunit n=1 Tax=Sulfuriferula sp. AH1 TaxID=1985873 RepID=UPI000B3B8DF3|nr:efflux RND transporter periplasmic adaptor subunit [Sulfuriferula sp. AH1]ARU31504.1 hemolysin D [Sulfuriferula sp. AH1]
MNRKILIPILVVALIGVGGVSYWRTQHDRGIADTALTIYGNADVRQVQLAFNGSERIDRMLVQEGNPVKKGQLLAVLDTKRLEQNVAFRQSQVVAEQQALLRLQAGNRPEEIRKAQADAEAAKIDADNAERTYQRLVELVKQRFIAKQQADNAQSAAEAAQARSNAAHEVWKLAILGPRKEDIAAAQAALQTNEASLAIARKDLADASLYAPSDGVIQDRILEPGDMASPQRPVYTLALTNPIWIRAYVSGSELGKVKPGMRASVSTDSFPGKYYDGWVGYVSPSAEFTPKSVETVEVRSNLVYQVRILTCNTQNELRLGMPATVTIRLDQPPPPQSNGMAVCNKT